MRVHHTIQVRPQGEPSMLGHTVRVRDRQKARERTKKIEVLTPSEPVQREAGGRELLRIRDDFRDSHQAVCCLQETSLQAWAIILKAEIGARVPCDHRRVSRLLERALQQQILREAKEIKVCEKHMSELFPPGREY